MSPCPCRIPEAQPIYKPSILKVIDNDILLLLLPAISTGKLLPLAQPQIQPALHPLAAAGTRTWRFACFGRTRLFHVGRGRYVACDTCHTFVFVGRNLMGSWRLANEDIWRNTCRSIEGYEEVEVPG